MTDDLGPLAKAAAGMKRIVEEIDGAMNHGIWRDERGMRLKDTPEWVALYNAIGDHPAAPAPVVPAERVTNRRAYQVGYAAGKAAALRSAPPVGARVTVQEAARVLLDAIGDYDRNRGHSDYDPSLPVGDALLSALAALLPAGEGEE